MCWQAEGHYNQFDDLVDLYTEKFAKPIAAAMTDLKDAGYLTAVPFDEKLEWSWCLAPRGPEGPARRLHERSGLHPVAWDLRRGQEHLLQLDPRAQGAGPEDGRHRGARSRHPGEALKAIDGHDWYFSGMSKESLEKVRRIDPAKQADAERLIAWIDQRASRQVGTH
jgi:hydroxylamine dehydrogenase